MIIEKALTWANSIFKSHIITFSKFGIVGGATAGLFFLFMWLFKSVIGIQYAISATLAYLFSTSFHFFANKYFTFRKPKDGKVSIILRYIALWVLNYFIMILIVRISVERMHLSPYLGVCASTAITMCTGYTVSRYWIFGSINKRK
jgi:putative flippase GtrA